MENKVKHTGGCHCGEVRFEVWAPKDISVWDCNCSICHMKGTQFFVVPDTDFKILQGEDSLTCYTFNTHQAKHTFCSKCGVQCFYTPRSKPDGKGVTWRCLDPGTLGKVTVVPFDGQNWETSIKSVDDSEP